MLHSLFGFINKPVFLLSYLSGSFFFVAPSSKAELLTLCPALGPAGSLVASLRRARNNGSRSPAYEITTAPPFWFAMKKGDLWGKGSPALVAPRARTGVCNGVTNGQGCL